MSRNVCPGRLGPGSFKFPFGYLACKSVFYKLRYMGQMRLPTRLAFCMFLHCLDMWLGRQFHLLYLCAHCLRGRHVDIARATGCHPVYLVRGCLLLDNQVGCWFEHVVAHLCTHDKR